MYGTKHPRFIKKTKKKKGKLNVPRIDTFLRNWSIARIFKVALTAKENFKQTHEEHEGRTAARRGESWSRGRCQRAVAAHLEKKKNQKRAPVSLR